MTDRNNINNDSSLCIILSDDEYVDDRWNRPPDESFLCEEKTGEACGSGVNADDDKFMHACDNVSHGNTPSQHSCGTDSLCKRVTVKERAEGDSASDVLRFKRRSFSQHVLSDRQNAEENEDRRQCFSQISPTPPTDNGIGHAEPDEKEIKKRGRRAAPASVPDEFFGVYCLISRSPNKYFKNRCYIGYTVDPNRRIRQHNAGKQFGGASRTDHRGPWDMVCIIHGFPNSVSALRFEWAWQNPDKSRRLRSLSLKKKQKESAFAFRFRIACHMLNSDPWRRLSLTFRWLLPSSEIAFPPELPLSPHMSVARGLVEKTSTLVPQLPEQYIYIRKCAICSQTISKISELVRCTAQQQSCGSHFHMRCLSKTVLAASNELHAQLFPISGKCPKCDATFIWGDLIRDQRLLLSIDKAKPIFINEEHAVSKVPAGKLLKI